MASSASRLSFKFLTEMNRVPKVSVLMPSYNYARYLPASIESVLSQSYSDLELIITDDCSTDESREVVEHFRRLDKRVVPVLHDVNHGLARARNSGLAVSSGEFVALCDADDVWLPNKLKTQMDCFRAQPELGLVHCDSAIIDGEGKLTGERFSSLLHRKGQAKSGNLFEVLCERNFLCVPTVILRREAIQPAVPRRLGLLGESFPEISLLLYRRSARSLPDSWRGSFQQSKGYGYQPGQSGPLAAGIVFRYSSAPAIENAVFAWSQLPGDQRHPGRGAGLRGFHSSQPVAPAQLGALLPVVTQLVVHNKKSSESLLSQSSPQSFADFRSVIVL